MTASLLPPLPLPDDPTWQALMDAWPDNYSFTPFPRSAWLSTAEAILRDNYPSSSSRDRKLTARHYAPFPLAAGHDAP